MDLSPEVLRSFSFLKVGFFVAEAEEFREPDLFWLSFELSRLVYDPRNFFNISDD